MSEYEDDLSEHIARHPDFFYGKEMGRKLAQQLTASHKGLFRRNGTTSIAFIAGLQEQLTIELGLLYVQRVAEREAKANAPNDCG